MQISLPPETFNIIYADPPWMYRDKCHAGKRGAEYKYPCMTIHDLHNLPVQDIAAEDCTLFLWVTWPMLEEGLELIKAWGFKYKTIGFVWLKMTKLRKIFWGMGNWTRANTEICLLATKGKPKRINAGVHSVIMSGIRKHSQKPEEARERIVQLMGDLPRIELFAREKTEGWSTWGNEI